MKTIHKYELALEPGTQTVMLPHGAGILTAQMQQHRLMLWAVVDPQSKLVPVEFSLEWTGQPFTVDEAAAYIGTVQANGLVWHIFRKQFPMIVHENFLPQ